MIFYIFTVIIIFYIVKMKILLKLKIFFTKQTFYKWEKKFEFFFNISNNNLLNGIFSIFNIFKKIRNNKNSDNSYLKKFTENGVIIKDINSTCIHPNVEISSGTVIFPSTYILEGS